MDITKIKAQADELKAWLAENAPEIDEEQKHLDEGSEARAYWHYGRLVALQDILSGNRT